MSPTLLSYPTLIVLLLLLQQSSAFSILSAVPTESLVKPGDTVRLLCVVDGHYEWCKFYHPEGGECDFEWKRSQNNITMQMFDIANMVSFTSYSFSLDSL